MKKILITGANSYIGTSFEKYINENYADRYLVDTVDMIDGSWRNKSFSSFDAIFHVAGIAHIKETSSNQELYYKVNRDLAIEVAEKAKNDGVTQFIVLSSMSVYGLLTGYITKQTECHPNSAYGKSKLMADEKIISLGDEEFCVTILRPPMVYGKGCKGNYSELERFALTLPVFPKVQNSRSMIYIDNLCELVRIIIDEKSSGLFLPQNKEYINTSHLVELIAKCNGKKIKLSLTLGWMICLLKVFSNRAKKAFGDLTYSDTDPLSYRYSIVDTNESICMIYKH